MHRPMHGDARVANAGVAAANVRRLLNPTLPMDCVRGHDHHLHFWDYTWAGSRLESHCRWTSHFPRSRADAERVAVRVAKVELADAPDLVCRGTSHGHTLL